MVPSFHFSGRFGSCAFACAFLLLLLQPVHCFLLWRPRAVVEIATEWSKLQISVLLGAGVGFFSMVALILLLIPVLIMTWTAVLVIQFLFGKGLKQKHLFIRDGKQMANEIVRRTLVNILQEGKVAGVVAGTVCLVTLNKL